MKTLITGAAGFIGGFLAQHCAAAGVTVLGTGLNAAPETWSARPFKTCDVRDRLRLTDLIADFRPDCIFHLAAQSYPTVSLEYPRETMDINAGGTINLFESLRALQIRPMVVVACSSAEYGPVKAQDLPVRETHALNPLHPYGVSKVAQDLLTAQYFANYQIPCVRIRIFNTTGPGKVGDVCSDLTRRAVEIERGMRSPKLKVGNLTHRAIIDVRDLVRGLWISTTCCGVGDVYNLGATQIYSVREIIDHIRSKSLVPFDLETDDALVRGCDEPVIAGDITKFQNCSGWSPQVDIGQTLQDMLEWWRNRFDAGEAVPGESMLSQVSELQA